MTADDLVAGIRGLEAISANMHGLVEGPNSVTHVVRQLQIALEEIRRGAAPASVKLEQNVDTTVKARGGGSIPVDRDIDIISERIINGVRTVIHTEVKTGGNLAAALDIDQLEQDAAIAIQKGVGKGKEAFMNMWDLTKADFSKSKDAELFKSQDIALIGAKMEAVRDRLLEEGFSDAKMRAAIGSFNFTDKMGRVLTAEVNKNGDVMFRDAMGVLFNADGTLAQEAKKAVSGSPDFSPAMNVLFSPGGKVADAAQHAAQGANLDPAMAGLEDKVEQGVTSALDEAGSKAQAHAAAALGGKIKEGAGALGNIMTSIPQLYSSVTALGTAWDKPLESTQDYMNLLSAAGGTISQTAQTVEALSGVTKIASAAQAIFNAIMAANPIVLVVLAVVALIAVIVLLVMYWDQVKAAIRDNPWLGVVAALFGVIGVIVLVIAYWDELKLAFLVAANFMSIQIQKIGLFFVGLKNLIGMVWEWVVNSVYNLGVGIINTFIEFGAGIVNFFVDLLNGFIGIYNDIADYVPGLDRIGEVARVNVEEIKIATREVPEIDVGKAFAHGEVKGGLEDQIANQEKVIAAAQAEDDKRRAEKKAAKEREAAAAPATPPAAAPGAALQPPALPAGFGAPVPAGLPSAGAPPALPAGAAAADESVHVEGGIHITINAERLEADSAKLLSDEMVRRIQERLDALRSERDMRLGRRPAVA